MPKIDYQLDIDTELLKKQIDAVLDSNLPEDIKTGVHNILGQILDMTEDTQFFSITSVTKDDIIQAYSDRETQDMLNLVKMRLHEMDNTDMGYLAEKMADSYCDNLFWDDIRTIFEDRFLTKNWIYVNELKKQYEDDVDDQN